MIGSRMKLGRLANALSLQELADALEDNGYRITRAALSKYETGKLVPGDPFLSALSSVLELDRNFFFQEEPPAFGIQLFEEQELIPKQESELMSHLQLRLEQHLMIDRILGLGAPPFEDPHFPLSPGTVQSDVENAAAALREIFGNREQAIASVTGMLESNGWYVFEIPSVFRIRTVSGIETSSGRPFLAFSQAETVDTTRYRILRELSRAYFHPADQNLMREVSRRFSRAFLFPKSQVALTCFSELTSSDYWSLTELKRRFGISKVQIRLRFRDLGLFGLPDSSVSQESVDRIQARKLQDSKLEPLYFYEIPVNFKLRVLEAQRKSLITREEASFLLPRQYTSIV